MTEANLDKAKTMNTIWIKATLSKANYNKDDVKLDVSEKSKSICGPHTYTYAVFTLNNKFKGVRCVLINDIKKDSQLINESPKFVWDGEGKINEKPYHHIGQAFYDDKNPLILIGSVSIVYDEQEDNGSKKFKNDLDNPLKLKIIKGNFKKPEQIEIEGSLKETWILQDYDSKNHPIRDEIRNYQPLEQVNSCGNNLK